MTPRKHALRTSEQAACPGPRSPRAAGYVRAMSTSSRLKRGMRRPRSAPESIDAHVACGREGRQSWRFFAGRNTVRCARRRAPRIARRASSGGRRDTIVRVPGASTNSKQSRVCGFRRSGRRGAVRRSCQRAAAGGLSRPEHSISFSGHYQCGRQEVRRHVPGLVSTLAGTLMSAGGHGDGEAGIRRRTLE
jgi:hypothetical protein